MFYRLTEHTHALKVIVDILTSRRIMIQTIVGLIVVSLCILTMPVKDTHANQVQCDYELKADSVNVNSFQIGFRINRKRLESGQVHIVCDESTDSTYLLIEILDWKSGSHFWLANTRRSTIAKLPVVIKSASIRVQWYASQVLRIINQGRMITEDYFLRVQTPSKVVHLQDIEYYNPRLDVFSKPAGPWAETVGSVFSERISPPVTYRLQSETSPWSDLNGVEVTKSTVILNAVVDGKQAKLVYQRQ